LVVVVRSTSSDWRKRSSESRRSVMSWTTPTMPKGAPEAPNSGRAVEA